MTINNRWLVFSLLLIATISSLIARAQLAISQIGSVSQEEGEILLALILRESSYLGLAAFSISILIKNKNGVMLLTVLATFTLACLAKMAVSGQSMVNLIYGIRILVLMLTIPALHYLCEWNNQRWIEVLASFVKLFILLLIPITLYQLYFFPAQFGATFLGTRTNGVFPNPILYSMAIASFSLFLFASKDKKVKIWTTLCLALAISTGGRAGILGCIIVSLGLMIPQTQRINWLLKFVIPIAGTLLFLLISSPMITGREGTNTGFNDGRIAIWGEIINNTIEGGIGDILLGTGIGDGTNASSRNSDLQEYVSDSTFIMLFRSFGVIGLLGFLIAIYSAFKLAPNSGVVALTIVVIFCMAQSLPEIHPVGIIVATSLLITLKLKSQNRTAKSIKTINGS